MNKINFITCAGFLLSTLLFTFSADVYAKNNKDLCANELSASEASHNLAAYGLKDPRSSGSIQIPKVPPFSMTDTGLVKSGQFTRQPSFNDLPKAERTISVRFFDQDSEVEVLIVGENLFKKLDKKRSKVLHKIDEENDPDIVSFYEDLIEKIEEMPAIDILAHLTNKQRAIVRYFIKGSLSSTKPSLDWAAQAIAVAGALNLPMTKMYHGHSLKVWSKKIQAYNKGVDDHYKLLVSELLPRADKVRESFLNKVEKNVRDSWYQRDKRISYNRMLTDSVRSQLASFVSDLKTTLLREYPNLKNEIREIANAWSQIDTYSDWVAQKSKGAPPHSYLNASEVRRKVEETNAFPELTALVNFVSKFIARFYAGILVQANKLWAKTQTSNFTQIVQNLFSSNIEKAVADLKKSIPKKYERLGNSVRLLVEEFEDGDSHKNWIKNQKPDLAFGESILSPAFPTALEVSGDTEALVDQLAVLGSVGTNADFQLLRQMLSCLDVKLLRMLVRAGYTIIIARNNVTNGAKELRANRTAGGVVLDNAEGLHSTMPGQKRILLRSVMRNGQVTLDIGSLMHEIGHAIDLVVKATKEDEPLHLTEPFVKAFETEKKYLDQYFQTQGEFIAEAFARYSLDPERTVRKLPLVTRAFDSLRLPSPLVDGEKLHSLHSAMLVSAPVTAHPDPIEALDQLDRMNRIRESQGKSRESFIVEIDGEPAANLALVKQLGAYLLGLRAPYTSPFGINDGFVKVSAAHFNDSSKMQSILDDIADGYGTILYVDELRSVPADSPGFSILEDFFRRMGDTAILVLAGDADDLKNYARIIPSAIRRRIKIDPLSPDQVAELVRRQVGNDGYELSKEGLALLIKRSSGGGYEAAMALWQAIKAQQVKRVESLANEVEMQPEAVSYVLASDVNAVHLEADSDPLTEIQCMVGLGDAKDKVKCILAALDVARQRAELGIPGAKQTRQNLLFSGNPGTGKTKVAEKLAASLFQRGYVKRSTVAKIKIDELVSQSPEAAVKKLFQTYKDGVIFIDEFHQLKDTKEGQRVFRALIPYLADPVYANTVFIGAGYDDELLELLRSIDAGAESRFTVVKFADYSKDELYRIAESMIAAQHLTASPEVKSTIIERVVRKQRTMKYPGNARDVEKVLEMSYEKQQERLSRLVQVKKKLSREEITTLNLEDVILPPSITVDEVWREIDALEGLEDAKKQLRRIQNLMNQNRKHNRDVLTGIEPYIIIEGPAGSGKTTLANLIGKLFAANDVIPDATVVQRMGGELQAGFVGNSTDLAVRKMFESAWGKTLLVDEIGAIAHATGDYKKQAAKEILAQTENHRGKFIFVIADYAHNITDFLALDSGLPRRFGLRITLQPLSGQAAAERLYKLTAQMGYDIRHLDKLILDRLSRLAKLPGWASGGDLRTLANLIIGHNADEEANREGAKRAQSKKISARVVELAIDEIENEISKRPNPYTRKNESEISHAHAHEHSRAYEIQHDEEVEMADLELTDEDRETLDVMTKVDELFGDLLNDPVELARQEADPQSAYNQALAERLNVEPEMVIVIREKIRVKIKKMVEYLDEEVTSHFHYHCPYCDRIDSHACAYINYPMDWKIEKSKIKPWTEVRSVIRQREVEVEQDEIRERVLKQ